LYSQLLPNQAKLCGDNGKIALSDYQHQIISYLCSPLPGYLDRKSPFKKTAQIFSIATLDSSAFLDPKVFVNNLDISGVTVAVIDQHLLLKHPTLQSCPSIRDAFLGSGWQQLSYLVKDNNVCIASYVKQQ
jgi:hypothetical protein